MSNDPLLQIISFRDSNVRKMQGFNLLLLPAYWIYYEYWICHLLFPLRRVQQHLQLIHSFL